MVSLMASKNVAVMQWDLYDIGRHILYIHV